MFKGIFNLLYRVQGPFSPVADCKNLKMMSYFKLYHSCLNHNNLAFLIMFVTSSEKPAEQNKFRILPQIKIVGTRNNGAMENQTVYYLNCHIYTASFLPVINFNFLLMLHTLYTVYK